MGGCADGGGGSGGRGGSPKRVVLVGVWWGMKRSGAVREDMKRSRMSSSLDVDEVRSGWREGSMCEERCG